MGFCASAALLGPNLSPCRLSFPQKSGKLEVEAAAEKRDTSPPGHPRSA